LKRLPLRRSSTYTRYTGSRNPVFFSCRNPRKSHCCACALKRKIINYCKLLPRFGGFFASSGVFTSGRMCVIGKHWYSSQEQAGHFLRSCSLLSSVSSFPQSMHTYLPAPTFCPALYVFCSVKLFHQKSHSRQRYIWVVLVLSGL
jgi:hypothetical protein